MVATIVGGVRTLMVTCFAIAALTSAITSTHAQPGQQPGAANGAIPPPPPSDREILATIFDARPTSVSVHAGLGTPYGGAGIELEHMFNKSVGVAGGMGWALAGHFQLAAALRLRYIERHGSIALDLGASFGDDEELTVCLLGSCSGGRLYTNAVWANAALSYELRRTNGMFARSYAGVTHRLGYKGCFLGDDSGCNSSKGSTYPFLGIAAGMAF